MLCYYPAIKPYRSFHLDVGEGHSLYVEEAGSPDGIPVLFLHGGPGMGCHADDRRYFDPKAYRIILFDQRGCGRSTPHTHTEHNTTQALISDIERLRFELGVERWQLFGGSWGATLALLYAQAYPANVSCMVLRGTFLGRQTDIDWFCEPNGAARIFPEYWREFNKPLTRAKDNSSVLLGYHELLTGSDEIRSMWAAKAWLEWETQCATLNPRPRRDRQGYFNQCALSLAKISAHYFLNKCFLEPNQILSNMAKIDTIPAIIIHGRYDCVCPLENAYAIHECWPASHLQIIRDAGHSAREPAVCQALVAATNEFIS